MRKPTLNQICVSKVIGYHPFLERLLADEAPPALHADNPVLNDIELQRALVSAEMLFGVKTPSGIQLIKPSLLVEVCQRSTDKYRLNVLVFDHHSSDLLDLILALNLLLPSLAYPSSRHIGQRLHSRLHALKTLTASNQFHHSLAIKKTTLEQIAQMSEGAIRRRT
ncbi:hypothetical protein [Thalassotalea litorea]|uniref:hypothetical protein n=1 Tax=Thalassotalea litorea TaxID=2020715 RepID=UPI003736ED2F